MLALMKIVLEEPGRAYFDLVELTGTFFLKDDNKERSTVLITGLKEDLPDDALNAALGVYIIEISWLGRRRLARWLTENDARTDE